MRNDHSKTVAAFFFFGLIAISFAIPSTLSQPESKSQDGPLKLTKLEKHDLKRLKKLVNQDCLTGSTKYDYSNEALRDLSQGLRNCQDLKRYMPPTSREELNSDKDIAKLTSKYFNLVHSLEYEVDTTFHLDFTYLFYDFIVAKQRSSAYEDTNVLQYIVADCALRSHSGTLYMVGPLFLTQLILSDDVGEDVKAMAFERLEETIAFRFTGSSGDNTPEAWSETLNLLSKKVVS